MKKSRIIAGVLGLTTAALLGGTVAAAPAQAASGGAGACGLGLQPVLRFDGLGHYIVTAGFSGAKRAVAYSFTEYIVVNGSGRLHTQQGTLFFRSSLTKRVIGTLPAGGPTTVEVVLGGFYRVAGNPIPCLVTGSAAGTYT
ncbi:hypothetical protein JIG36_35380 [Actinoplanes sp. LDG1-06]|uniref:Uncharacterized protein n=1 Tax=Paractinoplanes ovalisporus TaxID=2810368 RepID=A0ABS2ANI2_9ACTN|nr:hypothetical protein [Actinoplanes ovalisporus]MBM2620796.1 hypothetical protein [Actinoplanes ovalisporus]